MYYCSETGRPIDAKLYRGSCGKTRQGFYFAHASRGQTPVGKGAVAYNVLKRDTQAGPAPVHLSLYRHNMPVSSGTFNTSSLTEILRMLVNSNQTGYLRIKEGEREGFLSVENGVIVNARIGSTIALHALFQFVAWRTASFDFHERPLPPDQTRDLAVYDPEVLITGIAFKEEELALLQQAIPSFEAVLYYGGGSPLATVEATPADLGLLSLANGHRTVREIAEMVKLSPLEVARNLARFRLAGVLDEVRPKKVSAKSALAATG